MSNIIFVRINLDIYEIEMIERLVEDKVITLSEARTSAAVKQMGEWREVLWARGMQAKLVKAS